MKLSLFLTFFACFRLFVSYLLKLEMISTAHPLLIYLEAISQEVPSCTLLTNDGGRLQVRRKPTHSIFIPLSLPFQLFFSRYLQVQAHLLSVLSPFLAALLAQAGPTPTISLPCSETLLRSQFFSIFSLDSIWS